MTTDDFLIFFIFYQGYFKNNMKDLSLDTKLCYFIGKLHESDLLYLKCSKVTKL